MGQRGSGHLRVSDAERDQVARELRDHCAVGRISIDELDARLEVVYRATVREDLGRRSTRSGI